MYRKQVNQPIPAVQPCKGRQLSSTWVLWHGELVVEQTTGDCLAGLRGWLVSCNRHRNTHLFPWRVHLITASAVPPTRLLRQRRRLSLRLLSSAVWSGRFFIVEVQQDAAAAVPCCHSAPRHTGHCNKQYRWWSSNMQVCIASIQPNELLKTWQLWARTCLTVWVGVAVGPWWLLSRRVRHHPSVPVAIGGWHRRQQAWEQAHRSTFTVKVGYSNVFSRCSKQPYLAPLNLWFQVNTKPKRANWPRPSCLEDICLSC